MRRSWWLPVIAASAAVLLRLPFLLRGDAFFTSDEAVEGLMTRHLSGLPLMLWGQGYKGVPEVYLDAVAFSAFGMGVVQMKSVTLGLWALAVALVTRLAQRWHRNLVAAIAAALLVAGPASLVFWSLSGNAEFVLLIALSALVGLDDARRREVRFTSGDRTWLWCGLAVWIHPVGVCLLAAFATLRVLESRVWRDRRWRGVIGTLVAAGQPPAIRALLMPLHAVLALLLLVFAFTFLGGTIHIGPISATHPQRMLRAIGALAGLTTVAHVLAGTVAPRRRALGGLAWFLAGLSPVIAEALRGGVGTSVISRGVSTVPAIAKSMAVDLLPIVSGLQDHAGRSLGLSPWLATGLLIGVAVTLVASARALAAAWLRSDESVAPQRLLAALVALALVGLLVVGSAYQDRGSSRYVMAFMGLFAIAIAAGLDDILRRSRPIGFVCLTACLAFLGLSQARWYATLQRDVSAPMIVGCLTQHGVLAATADYWTAYRLTFLSAETVIVVPDDLAADRYPPYRERVRAAPRVATVLDATDATSDRLAAAAVACRAPALVAMVP